MVSTTPSVEQPAHATSRPPTRHGTWLILSLVSAVVVGFLLLVGANLAHPQGTGSGTGVNAVGQIGRVRTGAAPDFQIQLFSGDAFRLSAQRGQLVLVNYWASWCPPCRDEAPVLERAWRRYQDRHVVLVGLDTWDSDRDARAFLQKYDVTYPTGTDPRGSAAIDYGVTGIPETFFIRPDGTMARHWIGPLTDRQITTFIEELLP